jgi:hypothetical protein
MPFGRLWVLLSAAAFRWSSAKCLPQPIVRVAFGLSRPWYPSRLPLHSIFTLSSSSSSSSTGDNIPSTNAFSGIDSTAADSIIEASSTTDTNRIADNSGRSAAEPGESSVVVTAEVTVALSNTGESLDNPVNSTTLEGSSSNIETVDPLDDTSTQPGTIVEEGVIVEQAVQALFASQEDLFADESAGTLNIAKKDDTAFSDLADLLEEVNQTLNQTSDGIEEEIGKDNSTSQDNSGEHSDGLNTASKGSISGTNSEDTLKGPELVSNEQSITINEADTIVTKQDTTKIDSDRLDIANKDSTADAVDTVSDLEPVPTETPTITSVPIASPMATFKLQAPAAQRNKGPIWNVLQEKILSRMTIPPTGTCTVLEIAAGTGVHTLHFASELRKLQSIPFHWYPTDPSPAALQSINAYIAEVPELYECVSPAMPLELGVRGVSDRPENAQRPAHVDLLICINMIHIASWTATIGLMNLAEERLNPGGFLYLYGPFMIHEKCAESNRYDWVVFSLL